MKKLVRRLCALTNQEKPFVFATVIAHSGSAPQSVGAKMIIEANGDTTGTIGGGIMEVQVEEFAKSVFVTKEPMIKNFKFNGKDATSNNAICGGEVGVLIELIEPLKKNLKEILDSVSFSVEKNKTAWILTSLPKLNGNNNEKTAALIHILATVDNLLSEENHTEISREDFEYVRRPVIIEKDGQKWMVEPLNTGNAVYIFGTGHIGRSLAEFTQKLNFRTVILDDRINNSNPHLIPITCEIISLDSFENAIKDIKIDSNSFIVIVTRDHLNDRNILSQVLRTNAGFIGMVGSQRKCRLIYDELRKECFDNLDFQRVHAPIGIPIEAETPEEISISILAEMIKVRAEM